MKAVVCCAARPTVDRASIWEYTFPRWVQMGYELHTGDSDGDFNWSVARNRAVPEDELWDVVLWTDAEIACPPEVASKVAEEAFFYGYAGATNFRMLTEQVTSRVLSGEVQLEAADAWTVNPFTGVSLLGVRRDLWEESRGFDERFTGFGLEDSALLECLHGLAGPPRVVDGPVCHLWHPNPPGVERGNDLYAHNYALYLDYRARRFDRAATLDYLAANR